MCQALGQITHALGVRVQTHGIGIWWHKLTWVVPGLRDRPQQAAYVGSVWEDLGRCWNYAGDVAHREMRKGWF